MDAYSGYNQIKMDLVDAPKKAFMSNHDNYYYNVMPSRLNNIGVTYQWLRYDVLKEHRTQLGGLNLGRRKPCRRLIIYRKIN